MHVVFRLALTVAVATVLLRPYAAQAAASSERAAAIVLYPHIVVDSSRGVDTQVQLSNSDLTEGVDVACYYQNLNRHCSDAPLQVCRNDSDCVAAGTCVAGHTVNDFRVRLTPGQPIAWLAGQGAGALPCSGPTPPCPDSNSGFVVPTAEDPFDGVLRCIAVDDNGRATGRNVLKGVATIERLETDPAHLDAAKYNAVGFPALGSGDNGDGVLVLGGPAAEYEGCPTDTILSIFFDGAVDPVTEASEIFTNLVLVSCGADLLNPDDAAPASATLSFLATNEFGDPLSLAPVPFVHKRSGYISAITLSSSFLASMMGTVSGRIEIHSTGAGVVAVPLEEHRNLIDATRFSTAADNAHWSGERPEQDVLITMPPTGFFCDEAPRCDCRWSAKSLLLVRDKSDDSRDKVLWKWIKGAPTLGTEFGDPRTTASYALCAYAGPQQAKVLEAVVGPDATKWRPIGGKGFKYKDVAGSADGIQKIVLKGSAEYKSKVIVKGTGAPLPDVALSSFVEPVTVQVVNSQTGVCWQGVFMDSDVKRDTGEMFKAKYVHSPLPQVTPTPAAPCGSPVPTSTRTSTITPTRTVTPTVTPTGSPTDTVTEGPSETQTPTSTMTPTLTVTPTTDPTTGPPTATPTVCAPGSTRPCSTGAPGICSSGTETCDPQGSAWGACIANQAPQMELCENGLDDDCDMLTDSADTNSCFSLTIDIDPDRVSTLASCTPNCPSCRYESGEVVPVSCPASVEGSGFIGVAFVPDYVFLNWDGDASGSSNPVNVLMNANKQVGANYVCLENEPNDGSASQTYVGTECQNQVFGRINSSGEADWFCNGVFIPPGQTISVFLLPPATRDYNVELYDAGSPFYLTGSYNVGAGVVDSFTYVTSAARSGFYSVRVIGAGSSSSSTDLYLLQYSITP